MITDLINQMFGEAEDYETYTCLAAAAVKPECKEKLRHIAEQEKEHYKILYDMVFNTELTTEIEQSFKHYAEQVYKNMIK